MGELVDFDPLRLSPEDEARITAAIQRMRAATNPVSVVSPIPCTRCAMLAAEVDSWRRLYQSLARGIAEAAAARQAQAEAER